MDYRERLRALAAATPAAEAPPGLRGFNASLEKIDAAFAVLQDYQLGRPLPEVLQAQVDYLRGAVAASEWVDVVPKHAARGILGALGIAAGEQVRTSRRTPASPALERVFLEDCTVVVEGYFALSDFSDGGSPPAGEVSRLHEIATVAAEFWAEPTTAARLATRLGELGVVRGERAAADLCFVLCDGAGQLAYLFRLGGGHLPPGVDPVRLLERAVAIDPAGLCAAARLATAYLMRPDARRALATALRALERVPSAGGGLTAVQLLLNAVRAIIAGGLGPTWRVRDVRPLLDRAQRALDGNRRWVPRGLWETHAKQVSAARERYLNHGFGEDTRLRCQNPPQEMSHAHRTCAACGAYALEMPQCGRCRGTPAQVHYCSPACQRVHWPQHKAARKAAAAAAAAASGVC